MDIYYLDINHCWTCIIWTYTTNGHILLGHGPFIMMNMNQEPQLDMDY